MGCESSSIASSDRQDNYSYVTYWSFGERLPVVEEKVRSTDSIRIYLETIAALVAHRLDHTDLLVESPEQYIEAAVRTGSRGDKFRHNASATSTPDAAAAAETLITALKDQGLSLIFVSTEDLTNSGVGWPDAVEQSQHAIFIFGKEQTSILDTQLRKFVRLTLDEDKPKGIITIIAENNNRWALPPLLAETQLILSEGDNIGILSDRIIGILSKSEKQESRRETRPIRMAVESLNDNDPLVREGAARALLRIGTPEALGAIFLRLGDENEAVRGLARSVLPRTQDLKERFLLNLEAGTAPRDIAPVELAALLGELRDVRALDSLLNLLRHRDPPVRTAAARALGQLDDPRIVDWLLPRLLDTAESVRREVSRALVHAGIAGNAAVFGDIWSRVVNSPSSDSVKSIVGAFATISHPSVNTFLVDQLSKGLGIPQALQALAQKRDSSILNALVELLDDPNSDKRTAAAAGLSAITKVDPERATVGAAS